MKSQITEFTFYEPYWKAIKSEDSHTMGNIAFALCNFMFYDKTATFTDVNATIIWNAIFDIAIREREKLLSGKTSRKREWAHFTFKQNFFTMMKSLNNADRGQYIKSICEYMFVDKTPSEKDLAENVYKYFYLSQLSLNLARKRKSAGSKGGIAAKQKNSGEHLSATITTTPIIQITEQKNITLNSLEEFGCYGNIKPENPILSNVDYVDLYNYVKDHPEAQKINKHKAVEKFKKFKENKS